MLNQLDFRYYFLPPFLSLILMFFFPPFSCSHSVFFRKGILNLKIIKNDRKQIQFAKERPELVVIFMQAY